MHRHGCRRTALTCRTTANKLQCIECRRIIQLRGIFWRHTIDANAQTYDRCPRCELLAECLRVRQLAETDYLGGLHETVAELHENRDLPGDLVHQAAEIWPAFRQPRAK